MEVQTNGRGQHLIGNTTIASRQKKKPAVTGMDLNRHVTQNDVIYHNWLYPLLAQNSSDRV